MARPLSAVCVLVCLTLWAAPRLRAADDEPLRRGQDTTTRFDRTIAREADRHGVRPELVRAIIAVESSFDPLATSPKGAQGLMQLMPATAAAFRVSDPFDPEQNIRGGVAYLGRLLRRYGNDETLALAAYNAGPEAVERYGNQVPPYRETTRYIRKVRAISPATAAPPAPAPREAIYRVDRAAGPPLYTNVRPRSSVRYKVVGTRR